MKRTRVPQMLALPVAILLSACGGSAAPAAAPAVASTASTAAATAASQPARSGPATASPASAKPAANTAGASKDVDACTLLTVGQIKTLYPQVTQMARVTANAKPLTCRYEDAKPVEYATLLVHQGGAAMDILGKDNPQLGLTNHPLTDFGQDAAYRQLQMQPKDPAQLSAMAAAKDGWQVELLLGHLLPDSAPGQPNFTKATDLLKAAAAKL